MSPPVAALGGSGTSPLYHVRCSVVSVSGHGGVPPCPGTTRLSRGLRGSCGARPLRPHASLLHNAALPSVPASRYAWCRSPLRALLGEGNRRYAKWPTLGSVAQSSTLPGRIRALRTAVWLPCGCCGAVALVRRFALGVWSVACGQSCCVCPARPGASPLCGIGPALVMPVRPQGAPSAQRGYPTHPSQRWGASHPHQITPRFGNSSYIRPYIGHQRKKPATD